MRLAGVVLGLLFVVSSEVMAADREQDRLDKGDVIITAQPIAGSKIPEITLKAVINAPPEAVWFIVDQCSHYKETMPRIKESKELSRVGTTVRCRVVLNSPGPVRDLVAVTTAQHIVVPGESWTRSWQFEIGRLQGERRELDLDEVPE